MQSKVKFSWNQIFKKSKPNWITIKIKEAAKSQNHNAFIVCFVVSAGMKTH